MRLDSASQNRYTEQILTANGERAVPMKRRRQGQRCYITDAHYPRVLYKFQR